MRRNHLDLFSLVFDFLGKVDQFLEYRDEAGFSVDLIGTFAIGLLRSIFFVVALP